MDTKNFFAELQRRNVYKAAVAYGVSGWLLVQIATQVFPFFDVPIWVIRFIVLLLLLGFPIAVFLAWVFELTPEGLKRTEDVTPSQSATRSTGRKLDFIIIGVLLAVIGVMAFRRSGPTRRLPEKSIAVLAFSDLSAAQDQEYFSDGLMEQIINALGKVHDLSVVARTSALAFRRKEADIREVGRVLGVNLVLEGSVRRGLGMVRIDARLINVATGYQLWSETYDSTENDFLILQSEIAAKVVRALEKELGLGESGRLAQTTKSDPEAYDRYLRGQYLLNKRTVDSMQKALALFQEAVAKDARFALAHAGAANAFMLLGKSGAMPGEEAVARAWAEVTSALALDPELADGYISRGILLTDFEWNWAAAETEFQKALALNPNSAAGHQWYARHLAQLGRFEEAEREVATAQKLDPLSPVILVTKAKIFFLGRKFEEAIAPCQEALELEPNFASAFSILGSTYAHRGEQTKAIAAAQKYVQLSHDTGWAKLELAYAYAVGGDRAASDKIVREVTTATPPEFSPYDMAAICSAWRDADGALRWLDQAIERRSVDVISIRVDPRLDHVRADSRFQAVLNRMVPRR